MCQRCTWKWLCSWNAHLHTGEVGLCPCGLAGGNPFTQGVRAGLRDGAELSWGREALSRNQRPCDARRPLHSEPRE